MITQTLTLLLVGALYGAQPPEVTKPAPQAPVTSIETTPGVIAEGFAFTEGPLWHDGKLLICDLGAGVVSTLTPPTHDRGAPEHNQWTKEEYRNPSDRAAGSALDQRGRVLLAHFAGKITRTEQDGTVTTLADASGTGDAKVPLARCNDLCTRHDGTIYFTDFGKKDSLSKGVFRIKPDGVVESLDTDYGAANGIALSHDEKTLYVADYGKNIILAYDVEDDGTLQDRRVFVDLSKERGRGQTDGLKAAADGRVFATGPGGVWMLSSSGEKLGLIKIEGGASNLCIGGKKADTLYITSGPRVLSVPMPAASH